MAKMNSQTLGKIFLAATCAIAITPPKAIAADSATIKILLSRAQAQAQGGHLDIAASTWKQVLASDPSNMEALRSLAAAEAQLGHQSEANTYIQRLRKLGVSAAVIGQLQSMRARPSDTDLLRQAASLSKSGQYSGAMEIYRKLYGNNPPAGEVALIYYDTEAALPAQRAHAIEGLRKLSKQFPADERYSITLGRVLTYDAATRPEGIALLQHYPNDRGASDALQQAAVWNEQSQTAREATVNAPSPTSAQRTAAASTSELAAGYRALNSRNLSSAEQHFREALAHEQTRGQANAGLGFVYMRQQNFAEATRQFENAKAAGDQDASVTQALSNSRFWLSMGEAQTALDANNTQSAIVGYRNALALKPDNGDALTGLGGTLLRAGRPKEAIPYLQRATRIDGKSLTTWRALFLAQSQASEHADAIKTAESIPANLRTGLENDSEFLGSLAADYAATGEQTQADRILRRALALWQTGDGSELSPAKRLQYASLLLTAKRYNTAARTFREVLLASPDNADAWRGLITAEHLAGRDAEALREFRQMPASISDAAKNDSAFLSMLAGMYQSQSQIEAARATLERAIKIAPSVSLRLQLASLEMSSGDKGYAAELYEQIAGENPQSSEAWIGWLQALHATNHDREALRQIVEMPEDTRDALRDNPEFLQAIASVYSATGNRSRAASAIDQVNDIYAQQGISPPAGIQVQQAWLLLQTGQNARLARVIQELNNNDNLTPDQQAQVSQLWSSWTLQRAAQLNRQGRPDAATVVLSTALRAFPSDIAVNNALADAYLSSGDPKRAMALYARQDIAQADSAVCESAIRSALAAGARKQAQSWLQASLDRFGRDPKLLQLAAEFEQQRGDSRRAAAYYRAALDAAGPPSIGELTSSRANPTTGTSEASATQDLFRLLSPPNSSSAQNIRRQTTDNLDQDTQESLWPARSTARSNSSIALSGNQDRIDDDPLPPLETDSHARRGRNSIASNSLADNSDDDFALPLIKRSGAPKTAQSVRRPGAVADNGANYNSALSDRGDIASSKSSHYAARTTRQEQRSPFIPDLPARETSLSSPAADGGIDDAADMSARDNAIPRMDPPRDFQKIDTLDSPGLLAALAPLPSQRIEPLPPLTGPAEPAKQPLTERQQLQQNLDAIETSSSPYFGGTSSVGFHNGQPGFDRLTAFRAEVEQSIMITPGARATLLVHPILLQGGTADPNATFQLGTLPSGATPAAQTASGVGGEVQLRTRSFGAALGYTPHGFLVENVTGRLLVQPNAGPVVLSFERQPIEDSQLSYAGLHDPGSATPYFRGNIWGGVISNAGSLQINRGDAASGWYAQIGGQYITGNHVQANRRIDGFAGAYWSTWNNPNYGKLSLGMNFFGMHYAHNQRLFTYGNGGYFSPGAYLLSNIPVTFDGHYGTRFNYRLAGAAGLQAFQEDASPYFPIDSYLQIAAKNPYTVERTSVGANYNLQGEGAYLITDHWHVGGFFSLDNSSGYNNDRLGFSLRYAFRPQPLDSQIGPTGIGSQRALRPLLLP